MYHFGKSPASEMDPNPNDGTARIPGAWPKRTRSGPEEGAGDRHVEVTEMTRPYTGFFAMRVIACAIVTLMDR